MKNFKDKNHRIAFSEAIDKHDKNDYAFIAAVYLLTVDHRLWESARRYAERNEIRFDKIKLSDCTPPVYTLQCVAKDLYLGTEHLTLLDLADSSLIPAKMFDLICNAIAIRRFGLSAISRAKSKDTDIDSQPQA